MECRCFGRTYYPHLQGWRYSLDTVKCILLPEIEFRAHRAGWCSSKTPNLYSIGSRFEFKWDIAVLPEVRSFSQFLQEMYGILQGFTEFLDCVHGLYSKGTRRFGDWICLLPQAKRWGTPVQWLSSPPPLNRRTDPVSETVCCSDVSRGSSVGTVTGYGLDGRGSISGREKLFFSFLQSPDWPWGPPSLLLTGCRVPFPGNKVAGRWTVFARSNAGIVSSNPTRWIDGCVVLCVGSGLATGWSPVQGALPTPYKIANLKRRSRPNKGL
jgi:hypothetical protein